MPLRGRLSGVELQIGYDDLVPVALDHQHVRAGSDALEPEVTVGLELGVRHRVLAVEDAVPLERLGSAPIVDELAEQCTVFLQGDVELDRAAPVEPTARARGRARPERRRERGFARAL